MPSTSETATFKHEALPDASTYIRLLEVTSADPTRVVTVHCRLTTWPKASAPAYTAISYTWGDPRLVTSIIVNGETMKVRQNCEDVLRQQCWAKGGYFWIDAICINQADNDEKSFQVAGMGEVYRDAHQTLACVGHHADDSESLFTALREHRHGYAGLGGDVSDAFGVHEYLSQTLSDEVTLQRLEKALSVFLARPYFQRVWIYQELFFGNDIRLSCGDATVELSLLWALYLTIRAWMLSGLELDPLPDSTSMSNTQAHYFFDHYEAAKLLLGVVAVDDKSPVVFPDMVRVLPELQCEDPRDRVFGTLAMIDWEGETPIRPDYSQDAFDLAVEILRRNEGSRKMLVWVLQDTIRIAHLMRLPDVRSRRLAVEILARRSIYQDTARSVGAAGTGQITDSDLIPFWAYRIHLDNARWSIQLCPSEAAPEDPELEAGSPTDQPNARPSPTIEKWSKGTPWDARNTDVLLPSETNPQDWLLIPDLHAVPHPEPPVALIARDHGEGQLQLVGKALFGACRDFPWKSFQTEGCRKCGVYLDHEDALVLAHSCNWRAWAEPFSSREKGSHMLQVDDYFQTRLCGKRSETYAKWIE